MTSYEWMIEANHCLIRGEELNDGQVTEMVRQFLSERGKGRCTGGMYPAFYTPPEGGKLRTILGQLTKTQIFSANMYELEILRLLCVFAPENEQVKDMTAKTLERLRGTCFGYQDDGMGECFDTSLVVLRFLAAAQGEIQWMQSRMDNYRRHMEEKKRSWYAQWYYWLCLSELPFALACPEIERDKEKMLDWLENKSSRKGREIRVRIIHNVLSRCPK